MEKSVQKIQVFYEIAMAIGKSLDLQLMLKNSLLAYLRKLNCIGALVYKLTSYETGSYTNELIFSLPIASSITKPHIEFSKIVPPRFTENKLEKYRDNLTLMGKTDLQQFYHIMQLDNFGFLVLLKSKSYLENEIILTLEEINTKLGQACEACVNNKALSENEERYRSMFYSHKSMMLLIDPENGRIVDANSTALKFYGYSRKQIRSKSIKEINDTSGEQIEKALQHAISGHNNNFIFKHKLANGNIRDVEVHSSKIVYGGKSFLYSIVFDITKQLKAEKDLIKAKEKAEESDKLKSAFLANMSHEIRTPMNGIIGFSEMMIKKILPEEKRFRFGKMVIKSSKQLLRIVNDILDISMIESGSLKIYITQVSINDLIMELFEFFKPQTDQKYIELSTHIDLPDEESLVESDKLRLFQILTNLLNNALKFTDSGKIKFGYEFKSEYFYFFVADTGIGISENEQTNIFERFRQEEYENPVNYGGAGLGLSISRKLVEMLGGKIWVESEKEKGSTFHFTIPYKPIIVSYKSDSASEEKLIK